MNIGWYLARDLALAAHGWHSSREKLVISRQTGFVCFRQGWAVITQKINGHHIDPAAAMICIGRPRPSQTRRFPRSSLLLLVDFSLSSFLGSCMMARADVLHLVIPSRFTFLFFFVCVCEWLGCLRTRWPACRTTISTISIRRDFKLKMPEWLCGWEYKTGLFLFRFFMAVSILPCQFTPSLLRKVYEGSTENRNLLSARAAHNMHTLRALLSAMEALPQAPWSGNAARFMANSSTPSLCSHVRQFFLKEEVRTINDRNICERRSCMKSNGKSPTFKFVSGEERRPSEVQRVSQGWRLPGATHSSADPTWIRKWLEIQAAELPELESVELELGSCCSDLEKQVTDEICRARKRQFEIPISSLGRVMPPSDFMLDSSRSSFSQTKKNWPERRLPRPSTPQTLTHTWNSFSSKLPL